MDRHRQPIGDERDHGGTTGTANPRSQPYTQVMDPQPHPEPNRPGAQYLLIWAFVVLTVAALLVWYRYVGELSEGYHDKLARVLITEGVSVVGAGLLFFGVRALVHRRPLTRGHLLTRAPLYAAALVAFTVIHTSWNWATRSILFPIAGLGDYVYGVMPLPYLMEFPVDVLIFTLMAGAIHISRQLEASRRRQIDAAQLEANLARAELDNLRLRLQPHFLFNALNTVSAVMYEDPQRADEVLDRLGELLRASLEQDRIDEVSLAEELGILDAYLAITRARGNNVELVVGAAAYRRRGTLSAMESRLDPEAFLRINRSEIVRIDAVAEIQPWFHGDAKMILRNGEILAWSRRFRTRDRDRFSPGP